MNVRAEPALHQRKKLFLFIGLEMQPLTQLKKWNTSGPRGIASQYSTPSCPLLSRKSVEMTDRFSPSQFSMRDHRSFRSHWRSLLVIQISFESTQLAPVSIDLSGLQLPVREGISTIRDSLDQIFTSFGTNT